MYKRSYKRLKAVIKSLQRGASINAACEGAGIDVVSLWRWRKADSKLDELIKTTYDSRIQIVEDALYKGALEGNVTSQIFFLKNRSIDRWRDRTEVKGEGFADIRNTIIYNLSNRKNVDNPTRGLPVEQG